MTAIRLLRKMDTPELSDGAKARNWRQIEQSMNLAIASTGASTGHAASTSTAKGFVGMGASKAAVVAGLTSVVVATLVSVAVVRSSIAVVPAAVPTMRPAITMAVDPRPMFEADAPPPPEVVPLPEMVAGPKILPHRASTTTRATPTGTLAEEVRLLAKAKTSIAEGDRESALQTLLLYRRAIAHPQLQPEAERLEAQANLLRKKANSPDL